jgi:nucleoside-triphosphatase THEP1
MATKVVDTTHRVAFSIMDIDLETCEALSSVKAAKGRACKLVVVCVL